jgi:hypothetical protein
MIEKEFFYVKQPFSRLTGRLFFPYAVLTVITRSHVSSRLDQELFHTLKEMVAQEITKAKAFYDEYGTALRKDRRVHDLIEDYRKAIARTHEAMAEEGVLKACSQCAQGSSGSCCFEGVEDWYDPVLLLINLLLDVPLPSQREVPKACFFVGPGGCKLRGRYAFCVNFLCPKLSTETRKGRLLRATGEELLCGWELEKELRRRITSETGQGIRP